VERYHELRDEVQHVQEQATISTKQFLNDPRISSLSSMDVSKSSEWLSILSNQTGPEEDTVTLSQLESALRAKWKRCPFRRFLIIVESAQTRHDSLKTELSCLLQIIKNETLFNLSLESPLLRDADILDDHSISEVWRGISC
jgi:hypothetical protein